MTAHRTRLGVPARPGWLVREQVELAPPDGSVHVVAHSEPVQDVTTPELAAGYGQLFAEHLPGYEEIDLREVQLFGGRSAVLRRYRQVPPDGAPLTQVAAYLVEGGVGHVVTATTTTSRFSSVEGDLLGLLAQVEIDRSAVIERSALTAPSGSHGARGTVAEDDITPPWRQPSRGTAGTAVSTVLGDLSADELVALAQHLGSDVFPYLDEADAADAAGDQGAAVVRAARRSLLARGLITSDADGSLVVRDDVRRAVDIALDPWLVVTLEVEGDDRTLTALAVDDDGCAEISHRGAGVYALRIAEAGALLDRMAELTDAVSVGPAAPGSPAVVPALAIDRARAFARVGDTDGAAREITDQPDLLQAVLGAKSFNRLRSVRRSGGAVHGVELVWVHTSENTAWVLEPTVDGDVVATTVSARPIGREDLYAELLALLP